MYNKSEIFKFLSEKFTLYQDLIDIPVQDCGENLILIENNPYILTSLASMDSEGKVIFSNEAIKVRKTVFDKLEKVAEKIQSDSKGQFLQVVYGHRELKVQQKLYQHFEKILKNSYSGLELIEKIHENIAVPEVSGHPTGGAIDVHILDQEYRPLNFGSSIWEFKEEAYTFNPFISKEAWWNRMYLRNLMISEGFAPYDGEWWHFSYGDKEWAFYNKQKAAIYKQI